MGCDLAEGEAWDGSVVSQPSAHISWLTISWNPCQHCQCVWFLLCITRCDFLFVLIDFAFMLSGAELFALLWQKFKKADDFFPPLLADGSNCHRLSGREIEFYLLIKRVLSTKHDICHLTSKARNWLFGGALKSRLCGSVFWGEVEEGGI